MNAIKCNLCPHNCLLREGQIYLCQVRMNKEGNIFAENYGRVTSVALDPIEKTAVSFLSLQARFCRWGVMVAIFRVHFVKTIVYPPLIQSAAYTELAPQQLVQTAIEGKKQNIWPLFTYNEPL